VILIMIFFEITTCCP